MDAPAALPLAMRHALLGAAHVSPLSAFASRLRGEGLELPDVDPLDGGVEARLLVLLETPGPRAVGTGIVSLDNPSRTSSTLRGLLAEAGLPRSERVVWNAVPQFVSTAARSRNASPAQARAALPLTQAFLDLLPNLEAALFCGRIAGGVAQLVRLPPGVARIVTFHPSPQATIFPERLAHLRGSVNRAAEIVRTARSVRSAGPR